MIGYVTIGTSDLKRGGEFMEGIATELGGKRLWGNDRMIGFGTGPGSPSLMVTKPYDGKGPTPGNGTMVALAAGSKEVVERAYKKAIAMGGKDEGAPGYRGPEAQGFYGAYFRDLDNNKYCVFCIAKA